MADLTKKTLPLNKAVTLISHFWKDFYITYAEETETWQLIDSKGKIHWETVLNITNIEKNIFVNDEHAILTLENNVYVFAYKEQQLIVQFIPFTDDVTANSVTLLKHSFLLSALGNGIAYLYQIR